uniref:Uncharacterized protein n=1 Tax=Anguilla anguilla TaxID=7936 RepID=A0A0E9WDW2_ANGAN
MQHCSSHCHSNNVQAVVGGSRPRSINVLPRLAELLPYCDQQILFNHYIAKKTDRSPEW